MSRVTSQTPEIPDKPTGFAQVGSAYYPILVAVFTALVIISNVTATKGVAFGPVITDGGFIVFPLTYVIGDVLSEVYGFKAARRAILLGFSMNVLAALAFWVTIYLPAADFYENQAALENVVHAYTQLIIAGLAGFIVGQTINAWVVVAIKERTKEKHLWARLVGSTFAGQLGDTLVFCSHRGERDRHHHVPRLRRLHRAGLALQDRGRDRHAARDLPRDRPHQAQGTHVRTRRMKHL